MTGATLATANNCQSIQFQPAPRNPTTWPGLHVAARPPAAAAAQAELSFNLQALSAFAIISTSYSLSHHLSTLSGQLIALLSTHHQPTAAAISGNPSTNRARLLSTGYQHLLSIHFAKRYSLFSTRSTLLLLLARSANQHYLCHRLTNNNNLIALLIIATIGTTTLTTTQSIIHRPITAIPRNWPPNQQFY